MSSVDNKLLHTAIIILTELRELAQAVKQLHTDLKALRKEIESQQRQDRNK